MSLSWLKTTKFGKDRRSCNPIYASATTKFIPLALTNMGLRGHHFQVVLEEFATILVTKPDGCFLLHSLFALTHSLGSFSQDSTDLGIKADLDKQLRGSMLVNSLEKGSLSLIACDVVMTQWGDEGLPGVVKVPFSMYGR
jgi:hypothetical protein